LPGWFLPSPWLVIGGQSQNIFTSQMLSKAVRCYQVSSHDVFK